jgi:hypothetical protein
MKPFFSAIQYALIAFCLFMQAPVHAEGVSFQLSKTGKSVSLSLSGPGTAYYPAVFALRQDGTWEQLALLQKDSNSLSTGETRQFIWAENSNATESIESLDAVMVRYFEADGVGLGQISFFNHPRAENLLATEYAAGQLKLSATTESQLKPQATWILSPHEMGAAPLNQPLKTRHSQPLAQRIDWSTQTLPATLKIGDGRSEIFLIHETAQGFRLQTIPGNYPPNQELRSAWLNERKTWFALAGITFLLAIAAGLFHRRKPAA